MKTEVYKGWAIQIHYDEKYRSGYAIASKKGIFYLQTKTYASTTEENLLAFIKAEIDMREI